MINTNNNIDENFNPAVLQSVYDSSFDDINNKALEKCNSTEVKKIYRN